MHWIVYAPLGLLETLWHHIRWRNGKQLVQNADVTLYYTLDVTFIVPIFMVRSQFGSRREHNLHQLIPHTVSNPYQPCFYSALFIARRPNTMDIKLIAPLQHRLNNRPFTTFTITFTYVICNCQKNFYLSTTRIFTFKRCSIGGFLLILHARFLTPPKPTIYSANFSHAHVMSGSSWAPKVGLPCEKCKDDVARI